MTMNEAADMYFEVKQGLIKPSSYVNAQRWYRDHIKDSIGEMELNSITNRELQKFYNRLATAKCKNDPNKTLSQHVIKDIVGFAKTILYFAMEEGEMQERRYKLKSPYGMRTNESNQDEYLDENYYKKVLENCINLENNLYKKAKVFTLIALTTGMRNGEICGLQWKDIHFENGTIEVKKTVQRITKLDGSSYINIGDPKSKTSKRTVIMPNITKQTLQKYKEMLNVDNEELYVLGNEKPTEPRTIRQSYKRYLKKLDIPYIHPHALRHTFTTYSISNGGDVKTISMLLGHANTGITLDTYTHITKRQIEKTVNKLNDIFSLTE